MALPATIAEKRSSKCRQLLPIVVLTLPKLKATMALCPQADWTSRSVFHNRWESENFPRTAQNRTTPHFETLRAQMKNFRKGNCLTTMIRFNNRMQAFKERFLLWKKTLTLIISTACREVVLLSRKPLPRPDLESLLLMKIMLTHRRRLYAAIEWLRDHLAKTNLSSRQRDALQTLTESSRTSWITL